jgi:hypothetical protein
MQLSEKMSKIISKKDDLFFNKKSLCPRSENNSVVVAHTGSTTSLPCQINKDTPHGVVSFFSSEK